MVVTVEIGCDHVVMAVAGVVVMVTAGFGCDFSVMVGVIEVSFLFGFDGEHVVPAMTGTAVVVSRSWQLNLVVVVL